jgi:energy-coupling factor transporter ATP-binding protein EcfA2
MIEKLAYCIKGSPREVELGQYTLVIGRNGIGKSAVSIAAQLAVADSAELNGKVVKLPSRLIDLGNADGAYAHAVLSNGTESSWGAARQADGSTKHLFEPAACVVPAEVLPLRAVRDVLSGNAETVRTAMLGWMVGGVSAEDVLAAVPAEMHARVKPVLNTKASPAAALLDAVRATEERVKLAKAGADAAEAAAEQLAGSEPVEESAVEEARAAVESWRRVLDQAIAFETASMLTAAPDGSADEERARARVTESSNQCSTPATSSAKQRP